MYDTENTEEILEIKFVKIRENSKLPFKKNAEDACYDLYFCPDEESIDTMWHRDELKSGKQIKPGESVLLQTGLKAHFPVNYMMKIDDRSSIASQRKLIVGATIVDPTYTNEIFVNLINVGTETEFIREHERVAQFYFIEKKKCVISSISEEEHSSLLSWSTRTGGFGSTN
jgi:deoxyuridine 5'-triphosphate nucleotidohydrolase